jgi:dolichyl-diphosphooligosaccharide--protein glycosyltransferase
MEAYIYQKLNKKRILLITATRKRLMSEIRKKLTRENFTSSLRKIGSLRVTLSHASLLEISILVLILTLAFTVRLLPMRWGYYLSEFDPYFQFRITDHFVNYGVASYSTWTNDPLSWWPWGRDVPHTSFPALGLTAATFYTVLNALGVPMTPAITIDPLSADPVYNFVIIFPAIMAVITCVVIYFFGKDIGGKETGLFAALFLAVNASYIGRTSLGFFDDETIGVLGILLISFFFLRSIDSERSSRQSFFYAVAAGLSLGYLFAGWGASRYAAGLLMLLVGVMLVFRRYSPRLLMSYSLTFGIGLFIATNVPFLGPKFLTEITNVAAYGLLLVLVLFELSKHVHTVRMKYLFVIGCVVLFAVLFIGLDMSGLVRNLETKYQTILNPFQRLLYPLVESVQEHRPAAWGSIYYDIGIGVFFIPVGFFFAAQNPTNRNIYLILFGLTSIYFASSMVRLTLIMAPAFCLLWALALVKILRPFVTVLKEAPTAIRRKTHFQTHVGREFSAAFLILIFLLLSVSLALPSRESSYPRFLDQAYAPTTIAVASTPYKTDTTITDWFDALAWIRNTPSVQAVASWWDYGYWITIIGNKPSIADNGTFNSTQIQQLGRMFMSNETDAYAIIQDWNRQAQTIGRTDRITHVLVFTTFDSSGTDLNAGDETKWVWMAKIGGLNDTLYGNVTGQGNVNWTDLGKTTIIYKMITYAKFQRVSLTDVEIPTFTYFKPAYFSNMNLPASERTLQGLNAVVAIYEVVNNETNT